MFSLVLLEASLPHLALAIFSPETSEEFNALIINPCLAVGGVKQNQCGLDGMSPLSQNASDELQHYPLQMLVDTQTDCLSSPSKWCFMLY